MPTAKEYSNLASVSANVASSAAVSASISANAVSLIAVQATEQKSLAQAAAARADIAASNAEAAGGLVYANPTAGLAATVNGQYFSVDSGGGLIAVYLNNAGAAVIQRTMATTQALAAPSGSALVGFTQSGTGSIARTVQAKARDVVSVKDFGAVGDGSTDDAPAFQAAVDIGSPFIVPQGRYKLASKITSSGVPVQMQTGPGVEFYWPSSVVTAGFDFVFTDLESQVCHIGDATFITDANGGHTALKLAWPDGPTGYRRLLELGRITIKGGNIPGQVGYWSEGIDTTNAWGAYCETLDFYGMASGANALANSAWIARGHTTEARCPIHARYAKAMLRLAGFSEGFDLSGSIAVACDYGVDCDAIMNGLNTPQIIWIGGHAACFKGVIRSVNLLQGSISQVLVYKRPDSAQNFIAFDLDSASTGWSITDCDVYSLGNPAGGTCKGVKDAGLNNTTILKTIGCNTDIELVASAGGFAHTVTRGDGAKAVVIQGSTAGSITTLPGAASTVSNNYFDILEANATTPSILGHRKWNGLGYFLTANSTPTIITDFMGWFPGDEIVVQANDANTTLFHSANLQLSGSVNKVLAPGDTVRLRRVTNVAWKQTDDQSLREVTGPVIIGYSATSSYPAGTLGAKAAEKVSVMDVPFGALGDNATDNLAAFNAATAQAIAQRKTLVIPFGSYVLSGAWVIDFPIDIEMDPSANLRFTNAASAGVVLDFRAASSNFGLNNVRLGGVYSPSINSSFEYPGYPASWSAAGRSTQDAITIKGGSRINIEVQYTAGWNADFRPMGTYDVTNGARAPLNINYKCNTADLNTYGVLFDGGPATAGSMGAIAVEYNTCFAKFPIYYDAGDHAIAQCNVRITGQAFSNEAGGAIVYGEGSNINTCSVDVHWAYAGYSAYDSPTGTSASLTLPFVAGDIASNGTTSDGNATVGYWGGSNNRLSVGMAVDQSANPGGSLPAPGKVTRIRNTGLNNRIKVPFYEQSQGAAVALSTTQGEANYAGGVGAAAVSRKVLVELVVPSLTNVSATTLYAYNCLLSDGQPKPMRLVPLDGTMEASKLIFAPIDNSAVVNRECKIEVTNLSGATVAGASYYCWIVIDD